MRIRAHEVLPAIKISFGGFIDYICSLFQGGFMMAYMEVNGARLFYTDTGGNGPVVMFSHGLLFSTEIFDDQIAHLKGKYRCIAYDHRGQGQSGATDGGYDMDTLTGDAAALLAALKVEKCHFIGLSMGGFVALRMALDYPACILSISVLDSSADAEPQENYGRYKMLNFILRWFGPRPVVGSVMPIMFGQSFLQDPARKQLRDRWRRFLGQVADKKAMSKAVNGVITRDSVYGRLDQINVPTLILVGDEDTATVPAKSERMHKAIAGSELQIIPKGGHVSTIDAPEAVNAALSGFLDNLA
jgi:pimeloyl-ACP methyl ester carboxylesterase